MAKLTPYTIRFDAHQDAGTGLTPDEQRRWLTESVQAIYDAILAGSQDSIVTVARGKDFVAVEGEGPGTLDYLRELVASILCRKAAYTRVRHGRIDPKEIDKATVRVYEGIGWYDPSEPSLSQSTTLGVLAETGSVFGPLFGARIRTREEIRADADIE